MSIRVKRILVWLSLVISGLMVIKLSKDIYKLWHVDDRIIEADQELSKLGEEEREIEERLKNINDPLEKEKQIRNTLKMAKSNEVVVVIPEEIVNIKSVVKSEAEDEAIEMNNWEKWLKVFDLI